MKKGDKWVDIPNNSNGSVAWWQNSTYSTEAILESIHMKAAVELLKETIANYSVDTDRVYVTGLSMGGFATWDILVRHPELFAAAVPVCGGCDVSKAETIVDIPIWTFHGTKDQTINVEATRSMVNRLNRLGANPFPIFTEYPNGAHDIWGQAYGTTDLFYWLLEQCRSDNVPPDGNNSKTPAMTDPKPEAPSTEQPKGLTPYTTAVVASVAVVAVGTGTAFGVVKYK